MNFDSEWARCKHWIEAALEYSYGTHTIEDVEAQIRSGQLQFWPGKRSAMITEILEYPRLKALHCLWAGGDLAELVEHMEPEIVAWGKAQGCTRATLTGRKGWVRVLANHGYARSRTTTVKEIA